MESWFHPGRFFEGEKRQHIRGDFCDIGPKLAALTGAKDEGPSMSFRASIERLKESSPDSLQIDWIPQAVLGKPTSFFERILGKFSFGSDDLDDFEGADFLLIVESDRKVPFSLRHYKGYPANTTAIYLPIQVEELEEIEFFVSAIVDALDLNVDLLEWRRSDNPEF